MWPSILKKLRKISLWQMKIKKILKVITLVDFVKKNIGPDKVRNHFHLTGKSRGVAHSKCNNNDTQDKSIFIPFVFTIIVIMILICFLKVGRWKEW